jgi:hypothetical protein
MHVDDLKLHLKTSFYVIVYVTYPMIAKATFSMFDCAVGPGN